MKNYITIEELKEKETELIEEYNKNMEKDWQCFADNSIKNLEAIRYVIALIENKNRNGGIKQMIEYYDPMCGNYCIPITEYTEEIEAEAKEFLKTHRDYFLMYLSTDDGYMEDMWCITNWLE